VRPTHVRLLVSDLGASYRFYEDVLGLPTTWEENPGHAEFEVAPEIALAVFPRAEMADAVELRPGGGDGVAVVLAVEDVGAVAAALVARGAGVGESFDPRDWGIRVAHLRDPDGNLVELYQDIAWEHDP
jgi:catechol 2,3-dioxygenase-like lactoylglutathione lyase family enzyme